MSDAEMARISARVEVAWLHELEALASANERSLSGELRVALSRHLAAARAGASQPGAARAA